MLSETRPFYSTCQSRNLHIVSIEFENKSVPNLPSVDVMIYFIELLNQYFSIDNPDLKKRGTGYERYDSCFILCFSFVL